MRIFNAFVLNIPYLFLKKIPYAWVLVITLWTWPPLISGILAGVILLGLWFMNMQQRAWEAGIASEYRVLHRDEPRAPVSYQVRKGSWFALAVPSQVGSSTGSSVSPPSNGHCCLQA